MGGQSRGFLTSRHLVATGNRTGIEREGRGPQTCYEDLGLGAPGLLDIQLLLGLRELGTELGQGQGDGKLQLSSWVIVLSLAVIVWEPRKALQET